MYRPFGLIAFLLALSPLGSVDAAPVLSLARIGPASVELGGRVDFELLMGNPDAVVGAFSTDLSFDPTVLKFLPAASSSAQFGSHLGDLALLEAISDASEPSPGILHLDEVSLLDAASLLALQGGGTPLSSLVLATLSFEGIGAGLGALAFAPASVQFSDENGTTSPVPTLQQPEQFQVVPEPASAALVLLALAVGGTVSRWAVTPRRLQA